MGFSSFCPVDSFYSLSAAAAGLTTLPCLYPPPRVWAAGMQVSCSYLFRATERSCCELPTPTCRPCTA